MNNNYRINWSLRIFIAIFTIWALIGVLVIAYAPTGPEQPETLWLFLFIPVVPMFGLLAVLIGIKKLSQNSPKEYFNYEFLPVIPLLFFIVVLTYSIHNRDDYISKLELDFEGTIVEKYRSSNHSSPSIRIELIDRELIEIEGIESPVWEDISIGDHIQKEEWSERALINGREMQLIAR